MKVEIKEDKEVNEKPFPKLMRSKSIGIIVLMSYRNKGVVVSQDNEYHNQWHYCDVWDMNQFEDFNGSITLSNE